MMIYIIPIIVGCIITAYIWAACYFNEPKTKNRQNKESVMSDEELTDRILSNLNGRKGIGNELDMIDEEVMEEIKDTLTGIITAHLKAERQAVKGLVEALEKIRNVDYRGNRSQESMIAEKALADYREATGKEQG